MIFTNRHTRRTREIVCAIDVSMNKRHSTEFELIFIFQQLPSIVIFSSFAILMMYNISLLSQLLLFVVLAVIMIYFYVTMANFNCFYIRRLCFFFFFFLYRCLIFTHVVIRWNFYMLFDFLVFW